MTERIGVGFVGAGGIARARHVPGFRRIAGVELVGVVNRTPASSAAAAAELGFGRTYAHWRDLVDDPAVDAVVVATWPYLHAPVTLAALAAGKHVLTQARMAMDATEARGMLAAALAHPELTAMVVPSPFAFFCDATVRRLLAAGSLGELRAARITWAGGVAATGHDQWRRERRHSGNNLMTLGIVYESIARWLGDATDVVAVTDNFSPWQAGPDGELVVADVPDHAVVAARFPGRVTATFEISAYARSEPPNAVTITGTNGAVRVDFGAGTLELARSDGGWRFEPVAIPDAERAAWRVEAEFVGAIRGTEQVRLTDFATGVRYMAFTDAVQASAQTGKRVGL